jgi:hypothetical protein
LRTIPFYLNICRASPFYTQKRKTKSEERDAAIMTVCSERGGGGASFDEGIKVWSYLKVVGNEK